MVSNGPPPATAGGCRALEQALSTSSHLSFLPLSVLDLNAFERQNKAEGLGMVNEDGTGEALSWASLSVGFLLPLGCAPTPTLPRAPFLQNTTSRASPDSTSSPDPCSDPQPCSPHSSRVSLPMAPTPGYPCALCSLTHHHMDPTLHKSKVSCPGCCSLINVPNPG